MNILNDFNTGRNGENKVADILQKVGMTCAINTEIDELSYFDLLVNWNDICFTIEVKNDKYASKSGNIAIEVRNSKQNKESGLNVTKADLWAHIVDDEVWITSVKKLKKFVEENEPYRYIENAGDGNANIVLYKVAKILPVIFICLTDNDELPDYEIPARIMDLLNDQKK